MALYRKYRPQKFSEVTGQTPVTKTLTEQLKRNEVAHAYLFTGPRGVGKTTTARLLARALNCEKRKKNQAEPCGECALCVSIANGSCFDVIEIDAASHTGVDNVRESVIEAARIPPQQSEKKLFIIDEAHMLSTAAFNALLKTLEEPPPQVIFVLATTELHKIPATIASRCQRFDFKRVSSIDLKARLKDLSEKESREVEEKVFDRIIALSEGCVRDAESILTKLFALDKKKITSDLADLVLPHSLENEAREFFSQVEKGGRKELFELIDNTDREGVSGQQMTGALLDHLSHQLRKKACDQAEGWWQTISLSDVRFLILHASETLEQVKRMPHSMLPLEVYAITCIEHFHQNAPLTPKNQEQIEDSPIEPQTIEEDWKSLVKEIRKENTALSTFLKFGTPCLDGDKLIISFRYKFYYERVIHSSYYASLVRSIQSQLSCVASVECILLESPHSLKVEKTNGTSEVIATPESSFRLALQAFGGEVIE